MNDFYKQAKGIQWAAAILLLIVAFWPGLLIIEWGYNQPLYHLLFFPFVPIAQFGATPFFRLVGIYTYYSPMLLGYMANNKHIDLHSGGSFDYLFVSHNYKPGAEWRNRLLIFHLEGLLQIIEHIEKKRISKEVTISGTSYFFNSKSLGRMGFEMEVPSLFYRVNLFVNFIDLVWMYSMAKGKWAIPKIWNAKKVKISGEKLVENKPNIAGLYEAMKRRTVH